MGARRAKRMPNPTFEVRVDPVAKRGERAAEDRLLTPAEVPAMLHVDPKTVMRWARGGKLSSIQGTGGHRRYSEREVRGFLSAWQGRLDTPTGPHASREASAVSTGSASAGENAGAGKPEPDTAIGECDRIGGQTVQVSDSSSQSRSASSLLVTCRA